MISLPGLPRLAADLKIWGVQQRLDLIQFWQDIAAVFNSRTTGVTTAIASGAVVQHNLRFTPRIVFLSPQDGTPTNVFASALTATTFTINYTGGGTHSFGWSAEP